MKRHHRHIILWSFAAIITGSAACKKFVEVSAPGGQSTTTEVFSSDSSATAAMNGVYSLMMSANNSFADISLTLYPGLSADELFNTAPNPPVDQFTQNTLASSNTMVQNMFWAQPYSYLYQVNAVLEGLSKTTQVSPSVKAQLTGEAEVVRAFCYFYLLELFQNVPLVTGTDYSVNAVLPQALPAQIYAQMVGDLQNAQGLLVPNYPTPGPLRPNRWTAAALLARIYLYGGNWAGAYVESSLAIDSGNYSLVPDPNKVFLAYSNEAIWQLSPVVPGLNTFEGNTFIPADANIIPAYALDSGLLNAFEPGDLRRKDWLDSTRAVGQVYYYPYKYKVQTGNTDLENYTILRLGEQYLIRAEALDHLGNFQAAKQDLDTIRSRAQLPPTTATDLPSLLQAIYKERRIELFCEWGQRWFDLKRTGQAGAVLSSIKPAWKGTDTLYPIPWSQLVANSALNQNPGY